VALVGAAFAMLMLAWVMSTRPFVAPDEASHYLRALSIADGTLLGPRVPYDNPGLTPAARAWTNHDTRIVVVSARRSPPNVTCVGGMPDVHGCLEQTPTGDYQPLPYLLPAVALKAANDATTGLWLARIGSALPTLAFIVLAFALLWDGAAWSWVGLMLALTPMVLFVGSVINPNGLEIASALAFAAGTVRVSRAPASRPVWVWVALVLSGVTAVLTWQVGPVFVALSLAVGAALLPSWDRRTLADLRRPLSITVGALVVAIAVFLAYGLSSGLLHSTIRFGSSGSDLNAGFGQLSPVLRDAVGTFGLLSVKLPTLAYWLWWGATIVLVAAALSTGSKRQRAVLIAVTAVALMFPVLFYIWSYRFSGFGLQGRYVLPMLILVPLVAGEVLLRNLASRRRPARSVACGVIAFTAAFQVVAWWVNARASAGTDAAVRFYDGALWTPPLGWGLWIALVLVGALLLVGIGVMDVIHADERAAIAPRPA
jgi:hypothetical protein